MDEIEIQAVMDLLKQTNEVRQGENKENHPGCLLRTKHWNNSMKPVAKVIVCATNC